MYNNLVSSRLLVPTVPMGTNSASHMANILYIYILHVFEYEYVEFVESLIEDQKNRREKTFEKVDKYVYISR